MKYLIGQQCLEDPHRTYFVGGNIGMGGTEGMKCSDIEFAS